MYPVGLGIGLKRTLTQSIIGGGILHAATGSRRGRAPLVSHRGTDQRGLSLKSQIPVVDQRRPGDFTCAWVAFAHDLRMRRWRTGLRSRTRETKAESMAKCMVSCIAKCIVCKRLRMLHGYGRWMRIISGIHFRLCLCSEVRYIH